MIALSVLGFQLLCLDTHRRAPDCSGPRGNDGCCSDQRRLLEWGTVHIRTDIWLTTVFGKELGESLNWVLEALTALLSYIKLKLRQGQQVVEPIFGKARKGHVITMDSCEEFMETIKFCQKEWLRLQESVRDRHLMTPILVHILDDNGSSVMGEPPHFMAPL